MRNTLAAHLNTLKRNLDAVPLEVLKIRYKKPFDRLRQDIAVCAEAYVKQITLSDIRIRVDYQKEAVPLIQDTVTQSGLLKQISAAAFRRQDIEEIDGLALELKWQIEEALKPFYEAHLGLYLSAECFKDPPKTPEIYCAVNGCVWRDGKWVPIENTGNQLLIFLKEKKDTAA